MGKRRDDWVDVFQALGEAFFAVLRSEWEVLRHQWVRRSFRRALAAAGLFFVAACLFLVLLALVVTLAVQMVEHFTELAPWQATLAVAAAVLAVILALAGVGYFAFVRRFENPVTLARQRLGDHVDWWRERLLRDGRALPEGTQAEETQSEGERDGEP